MKLLIDEPGSLRVRELWASARKPVSCRLLYPEARSALARAARSRRLERSAFGRARAELEDLADELWWRDITEPIAQRAGDLGETHRLGGADAVHLAAAEELADEETVFVTADADQRAAARSLGLAVAQL